MNGLKSSNVWTWDVLATQNLIAGNHILQIGYREDGTNLDKLYIGTNYPTEYGGNSTVCQSFLDVQAPSVTIAETTLYPNPAKNELNIRYGDGIVKGDEVNIYSSGGQLVLHSKVNSGTEKLDVAQLPAGVYLIKVGTKNKPLKFIKE
ncbi:T9SS type A sorting domain-containing protein [Chryseobacterium sp.]|uniref:T9SS type A sorting domain-containing protein n=1 Tax=Chryseobacterium sp. TaxID=1871047 RepID=UPI0031D32058